MPSHTRMLALGMLALPLVALLLIFAVGTVRAMEDDQVKIQGPVLGIDLGTTYSVAAIYRNGDVEIIPNELGNRITPSVVAFSEDERLVGDGAKNQLPQNPANTIYAVKRLIGRLFSDKTVQKDKKLLSYKIRDGGKGAPVVEVDFKGDQKQYSPEAISAMILQKMKEISETYLGQEIKNAVVTVPAYFTEAQRQATKDAGTIAGLNVVRVLNEPTAAALAYGLNKQNANEEDEDKNVLVFDLGGGTFDVSILTIDDGFFEVRATSGDTHLGGEDFDNRMVKYFVDLLKKKKGVDVSKDEGALARLRKACEAAKRQLSSKPEALVEVDSVVPGVDLAEKMGRAKFEELNMDLFKGTLNPVKQALEDSGLKKSEIHEVVLVGGSTRIPKVQQLLRDFFGGKQLSKGINPDESVAYGAAMQGAVLSGIKDNLVIVDVVPLTLGIETVGGVMTPIVERGKNIPVEKSQVFSTHSDGQTQVDIQVFEGERAMTKDNRLLGRFQLSGLAPNQPRGKPQIEVTFSVDENNLLTVSAKDKERDGASESITITNDRNKLTKEQIEELVEESKRMEEEDRQIRQRVEARNDLENSAYGVRNKMKDDENPLNLDEDDKESLESAVKDAIEFLDNKPDDTDKDDYIEAKEKLMNVANPILSKSASGSQNSEEEDDDTGL